MSTRAPRSARRPPRILEPIGLCVRLAELHWETLAANADITDTCDARLCAKLAKYRKQAASRIARRAVRRLLKEAA